MYEDVKVGDEFFVTYGRYNTRTLGKVEKVTPKRFSVKGYVFNKSNGQNVGAIYGAFVQKATDELKETYKKIEDENKIKMFVSEYHYRSLNFETIEKIYNILKEAEND